MMDGGSTRSGGGIARRRCHLPPCLLAFLSFSPPSHHLFLPVFSFPEIPPFIPGLPPLPPSIRAFLHLLPSSACRFPFDFSPYLLSFISFPSFLAPLSFSSMLSFFASSPSFIPPILFHPSSFSSRVPFLIPLSFNFTLVSSLTPSVHSFCPLLSVPFLLCSLCFGHRYPSVLLPLLLLPSILVPYYIILLLPSFSSISSTLPHLCVKILSFLFSLFPYLPFHLLLPFLHSSTLHHRALALHLG